MAYTFTVTEVTPNINLTVTPAANFTVSNAVSNFSIAETNPQWTITEPADNAVTINDSGVIFTLTNVDQVLNLTQSPAFYVTASQTVSNIGLTQTTNTFNYSGTNITFTSTTAIGQIQTENLATIFKGEFTSTAEVIYYRGHIVRYNQNIYVATVEPGGRITNPAAPPGNDQWTLIFSQTGLQGWQVDAMERAYNLGPWSSGATYILNSFVHHRGYIWTLINQAGAYNSEPSRTNPYWLQIGSQGDQELFTTSSVVFANVSATNTIRAPAGVFTNLTVTNRLQAGGIRYPITTGLYGQVLTTNGVNEANWTDVAAVVTATILRPATRDNLGAVIVGTGLNITQGGVLSLTTGTNGANIGWNLTDDLITNGFKILTGAPDPITTLFPVPSLEIGSGERGAVDASLLFESRSSSTSVIRLVGDTVRIGSGNPTFGTINYEVRVSTTGTDILGPTRFLGGDVKIDGANTQVYIGSTSTFAGTNTSRVNIAAPIYGVMRSNGTNNIEFMTRAAFANGATGSGGFFPLNVPRGISFADGTIQTTAATTTPQYVLTTATAFTLGGIKVGSGLSINPTTGVLSVTTTGNYVLPTASVSAKGGIRPSTSFYIADLAGYEGIEEFLHLREASTTRLGGIVLSEPFYMNEADPALRIRSATTSTAGVIRVGYGLGINNGILFVTDLSTSTSVFADGLHGIQIVAREVQLMTATNTTLGGVRVSGSEGLQMDNGEIKLRHATTSSIGGVKPQQGLNIDEFANLTVVPASTTTFGGITLGSGLGIDGQGKTYVTYNPGGTEIIAGPGLTYITATTVLSVNTATTSTIGGIKVGRNLSIDTEGFLNVDATVTATMTQFSLNADSYTNGYKIASRNSYPGNTVFLALTATNAMLYAGNSYVNLTNQEAKLASKHRNDIDRYVSIDDYGIHLFESGYSNIELASDNTFIRGQLSRINLGGPTGRVLAQVDGGFKVDLENNRARIYYTTATGSSKLVLESGVSTLEGDLVLNLQAANAIALTTPYVQVGADNYHSRMYVGVIQNYSGTGPPLLADGVQYGDLSVQRTAWPGYNYGQIIKSSAYGPSVPQDFNNLSLAVDFNR